MIKRETVEKVLVAPFRSRNTGFNVSSPPPPPPPSLLPSSWDRSDSDSDSKKVRGAGEHSRTNPQFRGFDDLRRRWPSRGFQRKARGYPRGGEGKGGLVFRREMRCLFRTEIGTTRSLRRSQTLECRYDEERTRHSSRIRPSRRGRKPRIGQKSEG